MFKKSITASTSTSLAFTSGNAIIAAFRMLGSFNHMRLGVRPGLTKKAGNKSAALKSDNTFSFDGLSLYSDDFKTAVEYYENNKIDEALSYFRLVYDSVKQSDVYNNRYTSYYGAVRALNLDDKSGLELCREAARFEKNHANVFFNLARAECHFLNRKETIIALSKGIQIDGRHPGILKMREQLGVRKSAAVSSFDRDHIVNRLMGKLLRKSLG